VTAIGVGIDLVEVARVASIISDKGSRVFARLLTPAERSYCESRPDPATHVAVRLAATPREGSGGARSKSRARRMGVPMWSSVGPPPPGRASSE